MEGFILANGWRDKDPRDYESMAQEHVVEAPQASTSQEAKSDRAGVQLAFCFLFIPAEPPDHVHLGWILTPQLALSGRNLTDSSRYLSTYRF